MIIDKNMSIYDLAEHMGSDATLWEAQDMLDLLIERGYSGCDTMDIRDEVWEQMLSEVVS
jgi:hypothetical protein